MTMVIETTPAKAPVVQATTCSKCGGALMPDTIYCQACGSACPAALGQVREYFGQAGRGVLSPGQIAEAFETQGLLGKNVDALVAFATEAGVPADHVAFDDETVPGTRFVRIVLGRKPTTEEAQDLITLAEHERAALFTMSAPLRFQVDVFTGDDWATLMPLGPDDPRPALVFAGPGGSVTAFFDGETHASNAPTIEEALTVLRRIV